MPTAVLKSYAEQSGKPLKEVEQKWEECKVQADKKFQTKDDHYWAYVNNCTKRKLGLVGKKHKVQKPLYTQWK